MKHKITALFIIFTLCLTGCADTETSAVNSSSDKVKIVQTEEITEKTVGTTLNYIGVIKAKETKKYSFLSGGKIEKIYVKEGEFVKAGSPIAKLDTQNFEYSAGVASNTTEQARSGLEKTISTYDTNIKNAEKSIETIDTSIEAMRSGIKALETGISALENALTAAQQNIDAAQIALDTLYSKLVSTRTLHENGLVTDKDMEALEAQYVSQQAAIETAKASYQGTEGELEGKRAELKGKNAELQSLYDSRQTAVNTLENLKTSKAKDVESINSQISSAEINQSVTNKNIKDSTLTASADCYITSVPYKEGEFINAGAAVVTVKGDNKIVTIGVADKDYSKISAASQIIINGKYSGTVDTIAQYPNESTRTYNVDISVNTDERAAIRGYMCRLRLFLTPREWIIFMP